MAGLNLTIVSEEDINGGNPDAVQTGDINTSQIDREEERSLFERIKAAPQAISDAITGEG